MPLTPIPFEFVTLTANGEVHSRSAGQAMLYYEDLGGGIGFEMVAVPGGMVKMGSLAGQGFPDEIPQHLVSLPGFYLGRFLVTQAVWQAVMNRPPSTRFHGANLPLENITWREATAFCQRLAKKTGRAYHLPSETQWECACRAGTTTPFSTGETITTEAANYVGEHTYRGEPRGIYRHGVTPAGTFLPNPWGLYDLHGNLWEYCAGRWHPDYNGAPFSGEPGCRVARGGSWHEPPTNCRCATRLRVLESERDDFYGFRVAL